MKFNKSILSNQNSKRTIQYLVLLLILFLSLNLNLSCEKGTEPEQLKPGRRDYTWTVDTLNINLPNYLTYRFFEGNSPNDLWLGTLDASYDASLWHYNGDKWETVFFPGYATSALCLSEDSSLWVGTKNSTIWKGFKGDWVDRIDINIDGFEDVKIFDFCYKSENDIYGVGVAGNYNTHHYMGIIMHYNGLEWKLIKIDEIRISFDKIVFQEKENIFFIFGLKQDNGVFSNSIYLFDGENIKNLLTENHDIYISQIDNIAYIDNDRKIYKYKDSSLVLWKDFNGTGFNSGIVGRSENDFISSAFNGIWHYNGIDGKVIYETELDVQSKIMFEKDIFVASEEFTAGGRKYIIIHGKLKE